nr:putative reverse transcriptase domain-containing protein [Tanacetum cinerariifolium]
MEDKFKPSVQPQRRVNPNIKEVVKKEVIKLIDAGLIYPIFDSPWVSPVHVVLKKNGMTVVKNEKNEIIPQRTITGWRVCIDYHKLNNATQKDHFLLLFIDQMLTRLARHEYYYFLDGFSGYFHIPIAPGDQEKTTFTYLYGTFSYRRMPFGLCNAPVTFQRCMTAVFHELIEDSMEVFMDEFLVFNISFDHFLKNLNKMLKSVLTESYEGASPEMRLHKSFGNVIAAHQEDIMVSPPPQEKSLKLGSTGHISSATHVVELKHKAYWAIKNCNMDLTKVGANRFLQINELDEMRLDAYESSISYKERTKRWHDKWKKTPTNYEKVLSTDITNKIACRKILIKNKEEIFTVPGDSIRIKTRRPNLGDTSQQDKGKIALMQPHVTCISELSSTDYNKTIEAVGYRKWISKITKTRTPTKSCCILINKEDAKYFDQLLSLQKAYRFTSLSCEPIDKWERTLPTETSLIVGIFLHVEEIRNTDFPEHYFNFAAYNELQDRLSARNLILTDYIGRIRAVGRLEKKGDSMSSRKNLRVTDIENLRKFIIKKKKKSSQCLETASGLKPDGIASLAM